MKIRDALTFAARLFRSGHRSDEAAALITLAREYYRLSAELARKRRDCAARHALLVRMHAIYRSLRAAITDR